MAYSTSMQMIYVNSSSTTEKGVSIDDLKRCFGVVIEKVSDTNVKGASCDLGVIIAKKAGETFTDVNGVQWRVKSRREINMWAKFKPIYHSGYKQLKNSERNRTITNYNCTYGIKRLSTSNYSDFEENGVIKNNTWTYDRPTGGTSSPYRLTDFVEIDNYGNSTLYGYSHKAICPLKFIKSTPGTTLPLPQNGGSSTLIEFGFTFDNGLYEYGWSPNHSLTLNDLLTNAEKAYYPTLLLLYKDGDNVIRYFKSGASINSITNGTYVALVELNTGVFCNLVESQYSHYGSTAAGKKWTACMLLTENSCDGTALDQLNSGKIVPFDYTNGDNCIELTVDRNNWVDVFTKLQARVTLKKDTQLTNRYYIDKIDVIYQMSSGSVMNISMDCEIRDPMNSSSAKTFRLSFDTVQTSIQQTKEFSGSTTVDDSSALINSFWVEPQLTPDNKRIVRFAVDFYIPNYDLEREANMAFEVSSWSGNSETKTESART